jgi:hypothetical protein
MTTTAVPLIDHTPVTDRPRQYSWPHGLGSRFMLIYAVLYGLRNVFPVDLGWAGVPGLIARVQRAFFALFGVTGQEISAYGNRLGSVVLAILAAAGALIWIKLDKRREHEDDIYEGFRVATRFVLMGAMFGYGLEKVFPVQMPHPTPVDLIRPFGEMRGTQFLWTWMGISQVYEMFTGWMEFMAGLLLVFRRTSTLGALLTAAATANVMVLNFGFEVPTSAYSWDMGWRAGEMFVMACVLIATDWRKLANLFLLNRSTTSTLRAGKWPTDPRLRQWGRVGAAFLVLCGLFPARRNVIWWMDMKNTSAIRGVYKVETFTRNGKVEPLAYEYPNRWRTIAISDYADEMMVRTVSDSSVSFFTKRNLPAEMDSWRARLARETGGERGTLEFSPVEVIDSRSKTSAAAVMQWSRPASDRLVLSSVMDGDTIVAELKRVPIEQYALYNPRWR